MVRSTPKSDARRARGASTGAAAGPTAAAPAAADGGAAAAENNGATGLFRAVLSWDFAALAARLAAGKGVIEGDLVQVPKVFTSAEVRKREKRDARGPSRLSPAQPPLPPTLISLSVTPLALRLHL